MIYYRYLSNVEFALDFLHNKCLRVSTPSQLNDPYDCLIRTAPEAYLNSPMGQQHSIKTRKDVEAYANLTRGTRDYYESHTADILEYMSPNELIPESCRVAAIEEANRQHQ